MGLNKPVDFTTAKLLKEKGFDEPTQRFYPKPKCKLFGIDEHGRYYPIVNKKQTYFIGEAVVLKEENAIKAPTIAEVVMLLYEKHEIWIYPLPIDDDMKLWQARIIKGEPFSKLSNTLKIISHGKISYKSMYSPTEAYEAAIDYTFKELI